MPHTPYQPRSTRPITPQEHKPQAPTPARRIDRVSPPAAETASEGSYHERRTMPIIPTYSMDDYAPSVAEIVSLMTGGGR